jgi:CTP:molybdopterin cytidylyltransferase MocA
MGDSGARRLLQRNSSRVTLVDMPDDGVLFDVDSPEDRDPEAGHSL